MKKNIILTLALPIQYISIRIMKNYPEIIERFYSLSFYKTIAGIEQILFGWIPFSLGDLLYILLGIALIRWLVKTVKSKFRPLKTVLMQVLATVSIFYFLFHFLWGLNYYRLPLDQGLQIKTEYTPAELLTLTKKLVNQTNALQVELTENPDLAVSFNFTSKEVNELAIQGYEKTMDRYPNLKYQFKKIKPSLFSIPLSYMGFGGYLNPLTNEAQYNSKIPKFSQPTLITHEMGHQLGYAKENEANFMAALTTIHHPNPYFDYAGHAFALRYCLADLQRKSPEEAKILRREINPGILKNYREINDFWNQHENPLQPGFKLFYGNYLKANNQPGGMKSYSYVVALLVNYYQGENAL